MTKSELLSVSEGDGRIEINIIPHLVQYVQGKQGRAGIRIEEGTNLAELAHGRGITLPPGSYVLPETYQRVIDTGGSLIITVGGITSQLPPKK